MIHSGMKFPNTFLENGATALYMASSKGRNATVQMLLDAGADIEKPNNVNSFRCRFFL